jgi:hypothetical protein
MRSPRNSCNTSIPLSIQGEGRSRRTGTVNGSDAFRPSHWFFKLLLDSDGARGPGGPPLPPFMSDSDWPGPIILACTVVLFVDPKLLKSGTESRGPPAAPAGRHRYEIGMKYFFLSQWSGHYLGLTLESEPRVRSRRRTYGLKIVRGMTYTEMDDTDDSWEPEECVGAHPETCITSVTRDSSTPFEQSLESLAPHISTSHCTHGLEEKGAMENGITTDIPMSGSIDFSLSAKSSLNTLQFSRMFKCRRGTHGNQANVCMPFFSIENPDLLVDAESKESARCSDSEMEHPGSKSGPGLSRFDMTLFPKT